MHVNRANPIHYNLRRLPHRQVKENQAVENNINDNIIDDNIVDNNNDNIANNINPVDNIIVNNMAEAQTKIIPSKFTGSLKDNAAFWIQKFEAYCNNNDINDDHKISQFILLIADAAENWFIILPAAQKDTYPHLREAFLARYGQAANNIADEELFYTKMQRSGEAAAAYINDMLSVGNKLQLNNNVMLATIKRSLLPELRAYVMSHNVANLNDLLQRAQLGEMIQNITCPTPQSKVHFATPATSNKNDDLQSELLQSNNELKSIVTSLTKEFAKLHISALEQQNTQTRARSPSPFRETYDRPMQNNEFQDQRFSRAYYSPQNQQPYCSKCRCIGHQAHNCVLTQQNFSYQQTYYRQAQPIHFYNNNRPRFNGNQRPNFQSPRQNFQQYNNQQRFGYNNGYAPRNFNARYPNNQYLN
jgi:hypothetical protein